MLCGCTSTPHYTITVYENGLLSSQISLKTELSETMIVIRDNQTNDWITVPGSMIATKLYPQSVLPTTRPN